MNKLTSHLITKVISLVIVELFMWQSVCFAGDFLHNPSSGATRPPHLRVPSLSSNHRERFQKGYDALFDRKSSDVKGSTGSPFNAPNAEKTQIISSGSQDKLSSMQWGPTENPLSAKNFKTTQDYVNALMAREWEKEGFATNDWASRFGIIPGEFGAPTTGPAKPDQMDGRWAPLDMPQPEEVSSFFTNRRDIVLRRMIDIVFGLGGTLCFLLVTPFIATAIKLEEWAHGHNGPVFVKLKRTGHNGEIFKIIKFRTLVTDAETKDALHVQGARDSRITHVGHVLRKYKIDEWPQFWQVLKGEMTVVGARPLNLAEEVVTNTDLQKVFSVLKPGLLSPSRRYLLKDKGFRVGIQGHVVEQYAAGDLLYIKYGGWSNYWWVYTGLLPFWSSRGLDLPRQQIVTTEVARSQVLMQVHGKEGVFKSGKQKPPQTVFMNLTGEKNDGLHPAKVMTLSSMGQVLPGTFEWINTMWTVHPMLSRVIPSVIIAISSDLFGQWLSRKTNKKLLAGNKAIHLEQTGIAFFNGIIGGSLLVARFWFLAYFNTGGFIRNMIIRPGVLVVVGLAAYIAERSPAYLGKRLKGANKQYYGLGAQTDKGVINFIVSGVFALARNLILINLFPESLWQPLMLAGYAFIAPFGTWLDNRPEIPLGLSPRLARARKRLANYMDPAIKAVKMHVSRHKKAYLILGVVGAVTFIFMAVFVIDWVAVRDWFFVPGTFSLGADLGNGASAIGMAATTGLIATSTLSSGEQGVEKFIENPGLLHFPKVKTLLKKAE